MINLRFSLMSQVFRLKKNIKFSHLGYLDATEHLYWLTFYKTMADCGFNALKKSKNMHHSPAIIFPDQSGLFKAGMWWHLQKILRNLLLQKIYFYYLSILTLTPVL